MNEKLVANGQPKYLQAYELLHKKIMSGEYPAGSQLPSCRALSRDLGISYLTVTNSLQKLVSNDIIRSQPGKGFFVCPQETTEQKMDGRLLNQVGFIIPIHGDLFSNYFTTIMRELGDIGMSAVPLTNVLLLDAMTPEQRRKEIGFCASRKLKSLVVYGDRGFPFRFLHEFAVGIPQLTFVLANDSELDFPMANNILCDYRKGGQMAARHLLEQGVQRMALLSYEEMPETKRRLNGTDSGTHEQKLFDGIEDAHREAGKDFFANCEFIRDKGANNMPNEEGVDAFLRSAAGACCGVIALGDMRAQMVYKAAARLGLKIGKDVLVIGFYNTPWTEILQPNMSSISVQEEIIARLTAQAVVENWSARQVLVEPKLIIRESSH